MIGDDGKLLVFKGIVVVGVLVYAALTGDNQIVAVTVGAALGYGIRESEHQAFRRSTEREQPRVTVPPPPAPSHERNPE